MQWSACAARDAGEQPEQERDSEQTLRADRHPNANGRPRADARHKLAQMNVVWAVLLIAGVTAIAVTALLLVRRRAPEGSFFADGDRAAGVFGVLATGFAIILGFVVFLAFESFDTSRAGAEQEAALVAQQFETAQFMPPASRERLSGALVCYARSVVGQEWPEMRRGELDAAVNPWSIALFEALHGIDPQTPVEQAAFGKWLDQRTDREQGREDRIHGAQGVIPTSIWVGLFLMAAVVFGFMLFFADPGERWYVQAMQIGAVAVVITTTLIIIRVLDNPFQSGGGALRPLAMERTLAIIDQARDVIGATGPLPCDEAGARVGAA